MKYRMLLSLLLLGSHSLWGMEVVLPQDQRDSRTAGFLASANVLDGGDDAAPQAASPSSGDGLFPPGEDALPLMQPDEDQDQGVPAGNLHDTIFALSQLSEAEKLARAQEIKEVLFRHRAKTQFNESKLSGEELAIRREEEHVHRTNLI